MYLTIYGVPFVVLVALYVVCGVIGNTWNPWKLIEGADGRPSTSKLQWFLWTVVTIFAYVAVYTARAWHGHPEPVDTIPSSLLIAMGLSIATMTAAKGITVSYVDSGKVQKPSTTQFAGSSTSPKATGIGAIFQDDDGVPELSKVQLMAWTLIALGTYLLTLAAQLRADLPQLPDIAPALMVLMGLGQGAYLGKKLVTTTTPRLTGLSQGAGKPPLELTITGADFSDSQAGNLVTADGRPLDAKVTTWMDSAVTFMLPARRPDGAPWALGQQLNLGLIVGGQEGANTLPFSIAIPRIASITPDRGAAPADLTITGSGFSGEQVGNVITINGQPGGITAKTWHDTQIVFTLPGQQPDGSPWLPGQSATVGVIVDGQVSTNALAFAITP
jgi:hypothetical protein